LKNSIIKKCAKHISIKNLAKVFAIIAICVMVFAIIPQELMKEDDMPRQVSQRPDITINRAGMNESANTGKHSYYYYAGGVVNVGNGNLLIGQEDLAINSFPRHMSFMRVYNSMNSYSSTSVGYGWTHSYNSYLLIKDDSVVYVRQDGATYTFVKSGSLYTRPPGLKSVLKEDGGNYLVLDPSGIAYVYDSNGKLTTIKDGNSNEIVLTYTGELLSKVTDPWGNTFTFTYDDKGRMTDLTDGTRHILYTYDVFGCLDTVTDATGKVTTYTHGKKNLLYYLKDRNGDMKYFYFDEQNRVSMTGKAEASKIYKGANTHYVDTSVEYISGTEVKVKNALENSWIVKMDATGKPVKITDPLGASSVTTYNSKFETTSFKDQLGNTYTYTYDANGNLISSKDPMGYDQTNTYSTTIGSFYVNGLTKKTERNGGIWTYTYDAKGNVLTSNDPLGNNQEWTWDSKGMLTKLTDRLGFETKYTYTQGRISKTEQPWGVVIDYSYDGLGRMIQEDVSGRVYKYEYNNNDGLVKQTYPDNSFEEFQYDAEGKMTSKRNRMGLIENYETDDEGKLTSHIVNGTSIYGAREDRVLNVVMEYIGDSDHSIYDYDPMGRMLSQTDSSGSVDKYAYDAMGNLISHTNPNGKIYRTKYDSVGRVVQEIDPAGHTTNYTYGALDNIVLKQDVLGKAWTYEYDLMGQLLKETDPLGHFNKYSYNAVGNVLTFTNKNNKTYTYEYNSQGRRTKTVYPDVALVDQGVKGFEAWKYDVFGNKVEYTNADGFKWTYEYGSMDDLLKKTNQDGASTSYTYNKAGNVLSETDALGNTKEFIYDDQGRMIKSIDPMGFVYLMEYDSAGRLVKQTDPLGFAKIYEYDASGKMTAEYGPKGWTEYYYDRNGNMIFRNTGTSTLKKVNPILSSTASGGVTSMVYDEMDRLQSLMDEMGYVQFYEYDAMGNVISFADKRGYTTEYQRDALGRVTKIIDPLGNEALYTYDGEGNILTTTDGNGNVMTYEYNHQDETTSKTDPLGNKYEYEYSYDGLVTKEINPLGKEWNYEYDCEGRKIKSANPYNESEINEYDAVGNLVAITDVLNTTCKYSYDKGRRMTTRTNPLGDTKKFTYDGLGNIITVENEMGFTTSYDYFWSGQLYKETSAEGLVTSYLRDIMGSIIKKIDSDGTETDYQYDRLSNLLKSSYEDGTFIKYEYDAESNLVYVKNGQQTKDITEYSYDGLNRIVSINQDHEPWPKAVDISYDNAGNVKEVTDGTVTFKYTYNANNMLTKVQDNFNHFAEYEYDEMNRKINESYFNDVYNTYSWDSLGRVQKTAAKSLTGDDFGVKLYLYNNSGNLIRTDYWKGSKWFIENYYYDDLQRVVSFKTDLFTHTSNPSPEWINYTYNKVSDRVSSQYQLGSGSVYYKNLTYDKDGRIIYEDDKGAIRPYTYDGAGNLQTVWEDGTKSDYYEKYFFDNENRLVAFRSDVEGNHTFKINAEGWKIKDLPVTDMGTLRDTKYYFHYASGNLGWFWNGPNSLWAQENAWAPLLLDLGRNLNNNLIARYRYHQDHSSSKWESYYHSTARGDLGNTKTYYLYSSIEIFGKLPEPETRSGPSPPSMFMLSPWFAAQDADSMEYANIMLLDPFGSPFVLIDKYGNDICPDDNFVFGPWGEYLWEDGGSSLEWWEYTEVPEVTIKGIEYDVKIKITNKGPEPKKEMKPIGKDKKNDDKNIDIWALLDDLIDNMIEELMDHFVDELMVNLANELTQAVLEEFFGKAGKKAAGGVKEMIDSIMGAADVDIAGAIAEKMKGLSLFEKAKEKATQMAKDAIKNNINNNMLNDMAEFLMAQIKLCIFNQDNLNGLMEMAMEKFIGPLKDMVGGLAEKAAKAAVDNKLIKNGIKKFVRTFKKFVGKVVLKFLKKWAPRVAAALGKKWLSIVGQALTAFDLGWEIGTGIRGIHLGDGRSIGAHIDDWADEKFTGGVVAFNEDMEKNGGGAKGFVKTYAEYWWMGVKSWI